VTTIIHKFSHLVCESILLFGFHSQKMACIMSLSKGSNSTLPKFDFLFVGVLHESIKIRFRSNF